MKFSERDRRVPEEVWGDCYVMRWDTWGSSARRCPSVTRSADSPTRSVVAAPSVSSDRREVKSENYEICQGRWEALAWEYCQVAVEGRNIMMEWVFAGRVKTKKVWNCFAPVKADRDTDEYEGRSWDSAQFLIIIPNSFHRAKAVQVCFI